MSAIRTGIDISSERVIAAQVRVASSGWTLLGGCAMARTSGGAALSAEEAVALESLLFRKGFVPAPCVIAAPDGALRSVTMELPPASSGAPIDQLARAEFARRSKVEQDRFVLSYWEMPTSGQGTQVMAVGCAIEPTDEAIEALERAGLRVGGVDDPARALGRVLAAAPTIATVRVGARLDAWGASIVVLHHGALLYARRPTALALGVTSDAEAAQRLATEIDACIGFARHRSRSHAPAAISVLGQAGLNGTVMDILAQRFGGSLAQPVMANGEPLDPTLAGAIGLALLEDMA
jgi:Tfp pilus assembly PilM family ATPase